MENGKLLPAWRYSLLANEREKMDEGLLASILSQSLYTLQSDEYVLPSTKSDPEDKSFCYVNGNLHNTSEVKIFMVCRICQCWQDFKPHEKL